MPFVGLKLKFCTVLKSVKSHYQSEFLILQYAHLDQNTSPVIS